jgi:hypothetical protein
MEIIVDFIDEVIHNPESENKLKSISAEVISMMADRPLFV